jgi:hypothetical protein
VTADDEGPAAGLVSEIIFRNQSGGFGHFENFADSIWGVFFGGSIKATIIHGHVRLGRWSKNSKIDFVSGAEI